MPHPRLMPEWEAQRIVAMAERVKSTGQTEIGREWRTQVEPEDDGEVREFFLDFTVDPHTDADGNVRGIVGYALDVTARVLERQAVQQRAAEAAHRYEAVRDVVAELQQVLRPRDLPVLAKATVAARYLVAVQDQTAGGYWFNAVPLPGGALALVVGDVVGRGVAASAAMGRLRTLLHEMLRETGDVPASLFHGIGGADVDLQPRRQRPFPPQSLRGARGFNGEGAPTIAVSPRGRAYRAAMPDVCCVGG